MVCGHLSGSGRDISSCSKFRFAREDRNLEGLELRIYPIELPSSKPLVDF